MQVSIGNKKIVLIINLQKRNQESCTKKGKLPIHMYVNQPEKYKKVESDENAQANFVGNWTQKHRPSPEPTKNVEGNATCFMSNVIQPEEKVPFLNNIIKSIFFFYEKNNGPGKVKKNKTAR